MRRLENEQTYSNKLVEVLVVISQRGHSQNDVVLESMRRNDVALNSARHHFNVMCLLGN